MPELAAIPIPADLVEAHRSQIEGHPIVLFDGVCVFCNRTVRLLMRMDRRAILRFVPLESPLGQQLIARHDARQGPGGVSDAPEGIVLIADALTPAEHLSRRTEAFSDTLILLGGLWRALGWLLRLIPRPLREFGYSIIARYRYNIFGRYETCPLPTVTQRNQFIGIPG
jgi:predicted DCC family thiol-disulfide oxidoreductase YuxK